MTWNNAPGLFFSPASIKRSRKEQNAEEDLLKTKNIWYIEESGESCLFYPSAIFMFSTLFICAGIQYPSPVTSTLK